MDFNTVYNQALVDMKTFFNEAQDPKYEISSLFSTFSKPRPNETTSEPGRQSYRHCANRKNREFVSLFVKKYELNPTARHEVFLPEVEKALIAEYGEELFNETKEKHRQSFRFIDMIGSFINQTMTWGIELESFITSDSDERQRLLDLCQNLNKTVRVFDSVQTKVNVSSPQMSELTAQTVAKSLTNKRVMIMFNSSAGTGDNEEELTVGGGVAGDPSCAMQTQEENLFRELPLGVRLFLQFVLGHYVSTEIPKEMVERFVYRKKYAPSKGKCLVIANGNQVYFLSAANDNTKSPLTDDQQVELNERVFSCALSTSIELQVDTIVMGAFGIGVFKGSAPALGTAIIKSRSKFHDPCVERRLEMVMAYYIANPVKDETGANNRKLLTEMFATV